MQRCTTRPFGSLADWSTDCGHGASMGPLTGFAMNPARDFGRKSLPGWRAGAMSPLPAAETSLLPGAAFWPYRWRDCRCICYRKLIGRHLPCDICVVEEKGPQLLQNKKLRCNMTTGQLN